MSDFEDAAGVLERSCWRVERAERLAVVRDRGAYFRLVGEAIADARHSILILGSDVRRDAPVGEGGLGAALERALRRRPWLDVRILAWDPAPWHGEARASSEADRRGWRRRAPVAFHRAADHPVGGAHHQKLVVVDDGIAFTGGLDLVPVEDDLVRSSADPSRHDVQLVLGGPVAERLGDVARGRWEQATGERAPPPAESTAPWPAALDAWLEDASVGIARTAPADGVKEVRDAHLAAIGAARHTIYIENEYLTCPEMGLALSDRLQAVDGPEVIVVTSVDRGGRLDPAVLASRQAAWIEDLRSADRHGRLRIVAPVSPSGAPVALRSNVLVVDDRIFGLGSSNLTVRSMNLDTECHVLVEVDGRSAGRDAIVQERNRLVSRHLGVAPKVLRRLSGAPLRAAIDRFAAETGMLPDVHPVATTSGTECDPIEPLAPSAGPASKARTGPARGLVALGALVALAAVWAWSPAKDWVHPDVLAASFGGLAGTVWGPVVFTLSFVIATLVMVPLTALTIVGVLLFGPLLGGTAALVAGVTSALIGFCAGRAWLGGLLRRKMGDRVARLSAAFARGGILAVLAVRIIPVAPYGIVNLVAGTTGVRLRDFVIGTVLGLLPGLVGLSVAADRIAAAVRSPNATTIVVASVVVVLVAACLQLMRRWLERRAAIEPASRRRSSA